MKGPERLSGNLTSPAPSLGSPTLSGHHPAESDSDSDSDDKRQAEPSTKGIDTKYDPVNGPVPSSSTSSAAGPRQSAARRERERETASTSTSAQSGGGLGMRDKLYRLVVVPI